MIPRAIHVDPGELLSTPGVDGVADLLAIRRPRWPVAVYEPLVSGTVGVHEVDLWFVNGLGDVGDLLAIWGPGRYAFVLRCFRQAPLLRTVGVHDVELPVAVAGGGESDTFAVWGPGGKGVEPGAVRQPLLLRTVHVDRIDVGLLEPRRAEAGHTGEGDLAFLAHQRTAMIDVRLATAAVREGDDDRGRREHPPVSALLHQRSFFARSARVTQTLPAGNESTMSGQRRANFRERHF